MEMGNASKTQQPDQRAMSLQHSKKIQQPEAGFT